MNPSHRSDEELIARIHASDEAALQELLRRYHDRLCAFAHAMLRRRDLAQEAVANVFLNIWRRRETLAITTSVRSYLFAAAGNQALNLRQKQNRHPAIALDDVPPAQLAGGPEADTDLLYRELQEKIESLLNRMPPQRQLVFRMNRLEGLRYQEIADALQLSPRTVQNHMIMAMRQLALEQPHLRRSLETDRREQND